MSGYIGPAPVPQATQTRQAFTATSGQTTFNTAGYTPGYLDVYLNGVKLAAADYTATNGSDVVLASGAAANDILEVVAFDIFQVVDQDFTGDFSVDTDTLYVDSTNDRVGIGTTSPARKLTVKGSNNTTNFEVTDGSGGSTFNIYNNTSSNAVALGTSSASMSIGFNGLDKVFFKSDGKVGIGTQSPDRALTIQGSDFASSSIRLNRTGGGVNNDAGLQFKSAAGANADTGLGGIWFQNSLDDNAYALIRARTDDSTGTSGRLDFITSTSLVSNSSQPSMTIKSDGNVGIGVTNPSERLTVYDSGSSIVRIQTGAATGRTQVYGYDNSGNIIYALGSNNNTDAEFWNYKNGYLRFATNSTERMRIDSSGNVGIGHTDPSYARLHVRNDVTAGNDNFLVMLQNATTAADSRSGIMFSTNSGQGAGRDGAAIQATNNGVDGKAHITFGNVINNTYEEKVRFTTDGYAGVGTTAPERRLHVHSGTTTGTAKFSSALGGAGASANVSITCSGVVNNGLNLRMNGSSATVVGGSLAASVYNQENAPLLFGTNNAERMRIDQAGRVTMPYQPAFHAIYANGYSYTFTSGNRTAAYGRSILNRGNHYNTSTSLFTAPVSGVYQLSFGCAANATTHNAGFQVIELLINGTLTADQYSTSADIVNTPEGGHSCTFVVALNANDTVRPQMYHSMSYATGGGSNSWTQARNYFSGYLIG